MQNSIKDFCPAPTVVEGVLQYNIPIADEAYLKDEIKKKININPQDLATDWIEYCLQKLWSMPVVQSQVRFGRLYGKNSRSLDGFDSTSFINTAIATGIILENEARALNEQLVYHSTKAVDVLRTSHRLNSVFWGLHLIDFHLSFIDGGLHYKVIGQEIADEIKQRLIECDPQEISLDAIKDLIKDITKDQLTYNRIKKSIESVYIAIGDSFLNVYSEELLLPDLIRLADEDKYLPPGFESKRLDSLRLIGINELNKINQPSINIDVLVSIASYGGELSQGNVIKTHSLFPGEKAVVSLETYSKELTSYALTSSVLDTTSSQAEEAFSSEVTGSSTDSQESTRSNAFSGKIEAKATWGWGSAGGGASTSNSASSVSKRLVSNAEKALRSQATKVSNNRTVKVETSSTRTSEQTQRQSVVRTIENINVSKPLNFIFRQLTQNMLSLFTIRDLRITVHGSVSDSGYVCTLEQLPDILKSHLFTNPDINHVKKYYDLVLDASRDIAYTDLLDGKKTEYIVKDDDIEDTDIPRYKVKIPRGRTLDKEYLVKKRPSNSLLMATISGAQHEIIFDGILLDVSANIIKTEGVYVECFLSDNEGLDEYSKNLQIQAIEAKKVEKDIRLEIKQALKTATKIVSTAKSSDEMADLYEKLVLPTIKAIVGHEK